MEDNALLKAPKITRDEMEKWESEIRKHYSDIAHKSKETESLASKPVSADPVGAREGQQEMIK